MAQNKIVRSGPVALSTTTTTNILNPPTLTGGVGVPLTSTNSYIVLRHIRITNNSAGSLQAALWLGTTGTNTVGKEFAFGGIASAGALTNGVAIAANSYVDWYGQVRMDAADFLVGGASGAGLTIAMDGEIGVN